jgi:hypothetical protein
MKIKWMNHSVLYTNSLIQWILATNIETWRDEIIETTETTWKEKYDKINKHKDAILQHEFTGDSERTVRRITVDQSPMCNIPPEDVDKFWRQRWEQNPVFDEDYVNNIFPIKKFFDGETNDIILHHLTDKEKMISLISKRGYLTAPGRDSITLPFLKLEKESAAEMIIAMRRFMIVKRKIPKSGKQFKLF